MHLSKQALTDFKLPLPSAAVHALLNLCQHLSAQESSDTITSRRTWSSGH